MRFSILKSENCGFSKGFCVRLEAGYPVGYPAAFCSYLAYTNHLILTGCGTATILNSREEALEHLRQYASQRGSSLVEYQNDIFEIESE